MNLVLIYKDDFIDGNNIIIGGRRFRHILQIHKANVGKELTVGLLNGEIGTGKIIELNSDSIKIQVNLNTPPPSPLPLTLIVSLPRPKTLKKVLHIATCLGIKKIYLIESWKVEKSYWQSPVLEEKSVNEHLILGLEQAKDTILPEVTIKRRFKPFIEDEIPQIIEGSLPIVAHPDKNSETNSNNNLPITLAIGPEAGFTEYEICMFKQHHFQTFSLGCRILRVEFAIPAIISKLT
ncbi:MAG TPA: 16S rRNA (uracil(1498)-N(3))-methyltransferase [Victivallales bacterium]|nr:16S rRNA (uracil(1498)-N(3))-methyltransferase [Victivallales bacterium]